MSNTGLIQSEMVAQGAIQAQDRDIHPLTRIDVYAYNMLRLQDILRLETNSKLHLEPPLPTPLVIVGVQPSQANTAAGFDLLFPSVRVLTGSIQHIALPGTHLQFKEHSPDGLLAAVQHDIGIIHIVGIPSYKKASLVP